MPSGEQESTHNSVWADERAFAYLNSLGPKGLKVGLVTSRSSAGRVAQGVASVALPGDLSDIRKPVRSTIFETLTPGGGGGLRRPGIPGKERGYRCPEGYQFGGRYTDSKLSTCGRQLFDLPSVFASLMQLARSAGRASGSAQFIQGQGRVFRGADPGSSLIQSRAPQIPRVGPMSKRGRDDGITIAVQELTGSSTPLTMMIRRDGFPMQPVVSIAELRRVPDNRNMEEAAFLLSPQSLDDLGKDELGLLSNTGVTSLVYVFPNGSTIRMDRTRALSVGERRKLGKTVSAASQIDNSSDPLARLSSVVRESGDAISITQDFSAIKNAAEQIASGPDKGKPRWSVEAFKGKKGRRVRPQAIADAAKPETGSTVPATGRISTVEQAIEHINNGGNLSDIAPDVLMEAIRKANVYKTRKLGQNTTLFSRADGGVSFAEVKPRLEFESIGAHFSSSLQGHLELPTAKTRVAGTPESRRYLVQTPESVFPEAKRSASQNLAAAEGGDLVGLLVSDYLSDVRGRTPASIALVDVAENTRAISSNNAPSALAGLSQQELERRRRLALEEYLSRDGAAIANQLRSRSEDARRQILAVYEELIQRARAFRWDNYLRQLKADGDISAAEERHAGIIKSLFEQRLDRLTQSREAFAQFLGIENE